ncbi:MAG: TlpA family protein disulfide reductase [Burkholderiaceae bacterium]|jgi:thiol-disulfide isomerase/thioredoxin
MNPCRCLLAVALSALTFLPHANAAPLQAALVGKTERGAAVDLAEYKGKVVLLFFWSTDCSVCLDLLPEMRTNLKGWQGKDFVIVAVNQDRAMANLNAYERVLDQVAPPNSQMKIVWRHDPSYHDTFGDLPVKEPTTVVVDRKGLVVKNITGRAAPEVWDDIAELVLN